MAGRHGAIVTLVWATTAAAAAAVVVAAAAEEEAAAVEAEAASKSEDPSEQPLLEADVLEGPAKVCHKQLVVSDDRL